MKYYVWDQEPVGSFDTLEEAVTCGNAFIGEYRKNCDPEWPAEVEDIKIYIDQDAAIDPSYIGRVVAKVVEFNKVYAPDDCDEEGYSPSLDLWFHDVDYYVDYKMEIVT